MTSHDAGGTYDVFVFCPTCLDFVIAQRRTTLHDAQVKAATMFAAGHRLIKIGCSGYIMHRQNHRPECGQGEELRRLVRAGVDSPVAGVDAPPTGVDRGGR